MALAIAHDDAETNVIRHEGDLSKGTIGGAVSTKFFYSRDARDFPHACLNHTERGRVSQAHFHVNDQFQVIVGGKGKLGRHDLKPYCVHFSRAYTPYGPFVSDTLTPLTFFVMRAHFDPGSQRLPQELQQLKRVPDRRPWQITRQVTFPTPRSGTTAADIILEAVPGIEDDQGLAAYTLSMKPNSIAHAPDPCHGDGQYLVVVKGSLLHDNKEHRALALVFVYPKDGPFHIYAGSGGLEALVLNFPRPQPLATRASTSARAKTGLNTWKCALCSFVYEEATGVPQEGIAPGTRWQDVPETWNCPDCSASKADFRMIEP